MSVTTTLVQPLLAAATTSKKPPLPAHPNATACDAVLLTRSVSVTVSPVLIPAGVPMMNRSGNSSMFPVVASTMMRSAVPWETQDG